VAKHAKASRARISALRVEDRLIVEVVDNGVGGAHLALPGKPLPSNYVGPSLYCAVIVKRVDEQTRSKTSINELLRD